MKNSWIVPVAVVAFLLVATGFWGYQQSQERQQLEIFLGNQYQESFYKLLERVESVTELLGKGVVANSQEQFIGNLNDVHREAMAAQETLNQLPISNATLMKTSRFLTQVGDYSKALIVQNTRERRVEEEHRNQLRSLREQSANLSRALLDLEDEINQGTISWRQIVQGSRRTINRADNELLSDNFKNLVEPNEPFPVLIYDGPFSDHIHQREPKGLTGATVTKERARQIVAEFVDYEGDPNLVIQDGGDADGRIPAFQFSVRPEGQGTARGNQPNQPNQPGAPGNQPNQPNQPGVPGNQPNQPGTPDQPGRPQTPAENQAIDQRPQAQDQRAYVHTNDTTSIDISKKGGHVIWYLNPREVRSSEISREEGITRGEEFLTQRGYENMVPTYSWIERNILTISYAYQQDDVIIYPDLIKLRIALDNGQVIGFEALGYLMSHQERDLPEPEVTEGEVRELLNGRFDVESVRLALIPTPGLHEKLTWEVRAGFEEETYLFYYDVKTGDEINILKVIHTPDGTFTK